MNVFDLQLLHYSNEPLGAIRSPKQRADGYRSVYDKPCGLWLSVENFGDGWPNWCQEEGNLNLLGKRAHEIKLATDARILFLRSPQDIDQFTEDYSEAVIHPSWREFIINWSKVAQAHQGIIVAPYIWERRLTILGSVCSWYYTWDCASGCIWDAAAIASASFVGAFERKEHAV